MSTTSSPATFSELFTDLQNRVRVTTGVTATQNQAARYINIALQDMHLGYGERLWWAHRTEVLRTHAPYSTGTVSISNATTITGSSTLWNTNNDFGEANMRVGGKFTVNGIDVYEITTVTSDTVATLNTRYIGDSDTAATYTYFEDDYALSSDFLRPLDLGLFSSNGDIPLISPMEFRRRYPRNSVRGKPRVATMLSKDPSADTTLRIRVRLSPAPDNEYLIPYGFITNKLAVGTSGTLATALSSDNDEPIVPLQYRHIIVLHALENWYRDKKDDSRSQTVKAERLDMMDRMLGDSRIGDPRPQFSPRVSGIARRARQPWGGGVRKHVIGTAWDELRE